MFHAIYEMYESIATASNPYISQGSNTTTILMHILAQQWHIEIVYILGL
jgi:hypothetical protein